MPKIYDKAGEAAAEEGEIILDGPGHVAVSMTPSAAEATADNLHHAARQGKAQADTDAQQEKSLRPGKPPHPP